MKYALMVVERSRFPVRLMCRVLGISEQGYYAWLKREPSRRSVEDRRLGAQIRMIFAESRCRYGSPRVHQELREQGTRCGKKRVERLMRVDHLRARGARKYRATTDSTHGKPVAPNLLDRQFTAAAPNTAWVGDITYLWTKEGWMYLAVFIDLYSRMVVGWKLGTRLTADLVTGAFERARLRRRPAPGLIVHTDQGSQYVADSFTAALRDVEARPSMSRRGNCWDNAVAESFFHSLKVEAIHGSDIETRREMEQEVFDYVERFYNAKRRHSSIGYRSPKAFEQHQQESLAA